MKYTNLIRLAAVAAFLLVGCEKETSAEKESKEAQKKTEEVKNGANRK